MRCAASLNIARPRAVQFGVMGHSMPAPATQPVRVLFTVSIVPAGAGIGGTLATDTSCETGDRTMAPGGRA
ncbi:MAG: hypothetical protein JO141_25855 [Bradyrhizobium sp.]|nr:hypothetical protein [Bradyrhizobium sp.]